MSRGKYAARAAKRREVEEVEAERNRLAHELRSTQAALESCRTNLDEEQSRVKRLRSRLQGEIDTQSAPLVVALQEQVDTLRAQRDEAVEKYDKLYASWETLTDRLLHYVIAVDPTKPTRTEALGILVYLVSGEEAGVQRPDLVVKDGTLNQIKNNIERRRGWTKARSGQ